MSYLEGLLDDAPAKRSNKKLFIGVAFAVVLILGATAVYADSIINGPTTTVSSLGTTTTTTSTITTVIGGGTVTETQQNTVLVQPVEGVYTYTTTSTINEGTNTVTTTITTTSTAVSTVTVSCPDSPFC